MNNHIDKNIYYIYVLENDAGYIKIGITHDFSKRLQSLSGSNGGGHKIMQHYVSPATYLYTLEHIFHHDFKEYRIEGTEWFKGIAFPIVVAHIERIFTSPTYLRLNLLRKKFTDRQLGSKLETPNFL